MDKLIHITTENRMEISSQPATIKTEHGQATSKERKHEYFEVGPQAQEVTLDLPNADVTTDTTTSLKECGNEGGPSVAGVQFQENAEAELEGTNIPRTE